LNTFWAAVVATALTVGNAATSAAATEDPARLATGPTPARAAQSDAAKADLGSRYIAASPEFGDAHPNNEI
jgi:hypothetical protein